MTALSQLQERLQSVILRDDLSERSAILATLRPAARTTTDEMLGVYCNAYRARLAEILGQDLQGVARYLGEDLFAHVAAGYIDAHPSTVRNARWFSRHAPSYLARTAPFSRWPQVAELAAIELALADAFDAAEATPFAVQDLLSTPPERWAQLTFVAHPSIRRIDAATNAFDIWSALNTPAADDALPAPVILDAPQSLLIWREDARSRLRALPPAEARSLDALLGGMNVGGVCDLMATPAPGQQSADADQTVACLAAWCAAGLLVAPPCR